MNESELASDLLSTELGDVTAEYRENLLADLARDDASISVYGWHEVLSPAVRRTWPRLTTGERIVAFSMALYIAFYDFVRPHMSLDNKTPAQASRLTDHRWTWEELLNATAI